MSNFEEDGRLNQKTARYKTERRGPWVIEPHYQVLGKRKSGINNYSLKAVREAEISRESPQKYPHCSAALGLLRLLRVEANA